MDLKQSYTWLAYQHAKTTPHNMGDPILYNQMQLNEQNILKDWKKHGIIQVL